METSCSTLSPPEAAVRIRSAIRQFLQERLQTKLDKLKDDDMQREQLLADYTQKTWIDDAAQRISQIQQVTHALKFSHPYAKGSSLSSTGNPNAGPLDVGTHSVKTPLPPDAVGNAAALDVLKFLDLEVDGLTLLERSIIQDPALATAFVVDDAVTPDRAQAWMAAFATLPEPNGAPASHRLAKQIYWPLDNGGYHLLAPLFPSSLVHQIWGCFRRDRFSDKAKAAREAHRQNVPHPEGYREYPGLAIQNFGGTKPQNISQLNSERYGENWLLPSLPPSWQSAPVSPPLHMDSVFARRFGQRKELRVLVRSLRDFLKKRAEPRTNVHIRDTRAELVDEIVDDLFQFAAEIQVLEAGWSRQPECRLNVAEQCWLDPGRAPLDEDFAAKRRRGDWQDEVCLRFGNWLNAAISTDRTPMGEVEAEAWQSVLDARLRMIRLELANHD